MAPVALSLPADPAEDEAMRQTLADTIDGVWALRFIRAFVLPGTLALLGWIAIELVNMRDGVRDMQSGFRELHSQIMDIRNEASVAVKESEAYRRQSAKSEGETQGRLQSLENSVKALQDQLAAIWRRSQLERGLADQGGRG